MNNILEGVLKEFSKLAMIPRPSKHETKVANYLLNRLEELGISAEIDETGNVIGKVAATAGFEAVPLFVLQAHMDMVCVSDSTKPDYNPLTDSIELIRDEEYLRANGTSLGADDGIGIAIILYLLEQFKPVRSRLHLVPLKDTGVLDEEVYLDMNAIISGDTIGSLDDDMDLSEDVILDE